MDYICRHGRQYDVFTVTLNIHYVIYLANICSKANNIESQSSALKHFSGVFIVDF